jgi:hypothetical protein
MSGRGRSGILEGVFEGGSSDVVLMLMRRSGLIVDGRLGDWGCLCLCLHLFLCLFLGLYLCLRLVLAAYL